VIDNPWAFQARKSLGQNFLIDENVAKKIVAFIDPKPGELIVEIGPGFGILTRYILPSGCRYVGIEIDQRLVEVLQQSYGRHENFTVVHHDFRTFDLREAKRLAALEVPIRLIGNIPYHITSSIIFRAFEQEEHLRDMILMVQREVAERIVAAPGSKSYSLLSVISQTFARPHILFRVSRNVFFPRPEVDSSLVRWDFGIKRRVWPKDRLFFIDTVKRLFGQRRKTLRNSLKQLLDPDTLTSEYGIDLARRIETLSVEEIIELTNAIYERLNRETE